MVRSVMCSWKALELLTEGVGRVQAGGQQDVEVKRPTCSRGTR